MKRDIQTKEDVEILVRKFYDKVRVDSLIGPVYSKIVRCNLEEHLSMVTDFWENTLFYRGTSNISPVQSLQRLHYIYPLSEEHFARWILLFNETLSELYKGEKMLLAKQRAFCISNIIKNKLLDQP